MIHPFYGNYSPPIRNGTTDAPLRSFRSWFLRIEFARCGWERYAADTHMTIGGFGDQPGAPGRYDGLCFRCRRRLAVGLPDG
jgi:hypothetical protein